MTDPKSDIPIPSPRKPTRLDLSSTNSGIAFLPWREQQEFHRVAHQKETEPRERESDDRSYQSAHT
jgi:hypothetical protein